MPWKERIEKTKRNGYKTCCTWNKNIRTWFTAPHPKQTPAETDFFTEEPLIRSGEENLNTAETPSQTGNRYLWTQVLI